MKKWNGNCVSCYHYEGSNGCSDNICSGTRTNNEGKCSGSGWRFYAKREESERLLKLWDDTNGSVAEWRENDRIAAWRYKEDCDDCMGHRKCTTWVKGCGDNTGTCCRGKGWKPHFYANRPQTEALLKWHDDRLGTIQERLAKEERLNWVKKAKEADVEDLDLRVGDKVSQVTQRKGKVVERINTGSVRVEFKDGSSQLFSNSGGSTMIGSQELYHGHNLPVTVEEEKPVRMIIKHESVYRDPKTGELRIKTSGKDMGYVVPDGWERVYGPVKVQIPE